jgi:hypothetical protein
MPVQRTPVPVVGGGVNGLSTALFLAHHGIRSVLVERHPDLLIHPRARGFTPAPWSCSARSAWSGPSRRPPTRPATGSHGSRCWPRPWRTRPIRAWRSLARARTPAGRVHAPWPRSTRTSWRSSSGPGPRSSARRCGSPPSCCPSTRTSMESPPRSVTPGPAPRRRSRRTISLPPTGLPARSGDSSASASRAPALSTTRSP